eukprot:3123905-Rhodomonas_salina.1
MAKENSPLLRGMSALPRRQLAMALAGTCAVLAMVGLVFAVGAQSRRSVLQQQYVQAAMQQPVYYMPVQAAQPQLAAAPNAQPIVYYYVPAQPQMQVAGGVQMLPGNASGAGNSSAGGDEPDFVCTVANIKTLSGTVQKKWDTCKMNPNYEIPNKDAKRRCNSSFAFAEDQSASHD